MMHVVALLITIAAGPVLLGALARIALRTAGAEILALFASTLSSSEETPKRHPFDLLFALAFSRQVPLSLLILAGAGMGTILVNNLSNAIVQTSTPERLRGRVMGAYTWIFFGFMPLGALWSGTIAARLGEPAAVMINAAIAFSFAIAVRVFYPRLREE